MRLRFRVFSYALAVLMILAGINALSGQTTPTRQKTANPVDSEAILHEFAPDTIPLDSLHPKPANRIRAIRLLLAVKRQDRGWNRQLAVYLLASLGYDYARNRDELLRIWRHCIVKDFDEGCNENTAMTLVGLYRQGHKELLRPLLAGCRNSDGALSEELGLFYAEQLEHNPHGFLIALATFPNKEQQGVCELAADGDGGGMGPDVLHKVLRNIDKTDGGVAGRCARNYQAEDKFVEDNNRDLPAETPSTN